VPGAGAWTVPGRVGEPGTDGPKGQSPFVWSVIGAIAQACDLPIVTAVTCPTVRIHPAIIAQAAATSAVMTNGRFTLGVGTGENLNEHVLGDRWPHEGAHYEVDRARIYTLPDEPPPIFVSAFGPRALEVAARIGDGFITTTPDGGMLARFRELAGGNLPAKAGTKCCYAPTEQEAVEQAHRLWANGGIPGEIAQELPTPQHFEQASQLVTTESTARSVPCGPDPTVHVDNLRPFVEAGFDEVYVANMGPHYRDAIRLYAEQVLPELR
jgi:alkanesulfonate monooxygenase SsuD/methylene tetrahydromethanopterin reductase-like flavin-dependent oxidoreductase (luciferase family)